MLPFFQHLLIQNLFHAGFTEKDSMSENLKRDFISILEGIEDDILCGCEQIPDDVKIWLLEAKKQKTILPGTCIPERKTALPQSYDYVAKRNAV